MHIINSDGVKDKCIKDKAKDLTAKAKAKDKPVQTKCVIYQRLQVMRSGPRMYIVKSKRLWRRSAKLRKLQQKND